MSRIQVGTRVQVLQPDYVAGCLGVVCAREALLDGQGLDRWLIQVDSGEVLVSLPPNEFQVLELNAC
ncbi:hypothetical protein [Leptolyngbya sp. FACHB-261]|uniref:hypothetical protein n=1 Tax=Leptolyngbya sp. FACHB-261 TaxID=2692806 RepID=UPI0018EF5152|nr:hypothetical protein [Leptolyngbya sp. FACHB-261]